MAAVPRTGTPSPPTTPASSTATPSVNARSTTPLTCTCNAQPCPTTPSPTTRRHHSVSRNGDRLKIEISVDDVRAAATASAVLPGGARVTEVRLNGRHVPHKLVTTSRSNEIHVALRGTRAALDIRVR